jgi:hypothetical protein
MRGTRNRLRQLSGATSKPRNGVFMALACIHFFRNSLLS